MTDNDPKDDLIRDRPRPPDSGIQFVYFVTPISPGGAAGLGRYSHGMGGVSSEETKMGPVGDPEEREAEGRPHGVEDPPVGPTAPFSCQMSLRWPTADTVWLSGKIGWERVREGPRRGVMRRAEREWSETNKHCQNTAVPSIRP